MNVLKPVATRSPIIAISSTVGLCLYLKNKKKSRMIGECDFSNKKNT